MSAELTLISSDHLQTIALNQSAREKNSESYCKNL